jgi:predicted lipoprotein with Yx(FWY)xxD motif
VLTVVGSNRGLSLPRRTLLSRAAGAALLAATGGIHLDLYLTGYRTIPTIGWLFLLQVIAAFVLAAAVLATAAPLVIASGALFAAATLGGYLLSLRVGLFGFREVRTTAGLVAGLIEVAAFAVLVPLIPRIPWRAIAGLCVVGLVLLSVDIGFANGPAAQSGGTLRVTEISGKKVLTNAKGLTVYLFVPDTATTSRCYGSCASYWPPVLGHPGAGAGVTGQIGSIVRTGGAVQATYDGHPLYTYVGDTGPGQDSGNDLNLNGGLWYVVTRPPVREPRCSSGTWSFSAIG